MQTSALHIDRKTTHGPCDEARAFRLALIAARGNEYPMPVKFGRKNLGYLGGISGTNLVWHIPAEQMPLDAAGFPTLANLQSQRAAGFTWSTNWYKVTSSFATNGWVDMWASTTSAPAAGTYTGSAFTARQFTDTSTGAFPHGGSISPLQKYLSYISFAALDSAATNANTLVYILYDRVLTYELCTFTAATPQSMTNTLPALRYISAGQPGMQIVATCQAATGTTASNLTALSYTNNAGTSGKSMQNTTTLSFQTSVSAAGGGGDAASVHCPTFAGNNGLFLPLAPGDLGAQSIQSYTTSAANTGSTCFVLAYPLAYIVTPATQVMCEKDLLHNHMLPSRIYDGACLSAFIFCGPNSNGSTVTGRIETVWG